MRLHDLEEKRMGQRDVSRAPVGEITIGFEFEVATHEGGSSDPEDSWEAFYDQYDGDVSEDTFLEDTIRVKGVLRAISGWEREPKFLFGKADPKQVAMHAWETASSEYPEYYAAIALPEDTDTLRRAKLIQMGLLHHGFNLVDRVKRTVDELSDAEVTKMLPTYLRYLRETAPEKPSDDFTSPESLYVFTDEAHTDWVDMATVETASEFFGYFEGEGAYENFVEALSEFNREQADEAYSEWEPSNKTLSTDYVYRMMLDNFDNVNLFDEYHQMGKDTDHWTVEPDGSISPSGAEIVSPVMDYQTGLGMLEKICELIDQDENLYTNSTTGLHVNIGTFTDVSKIDLLKLFMFLGEPHVAKTFNRINNTYAQSYLNHIHGHMSDDDTYGEKALAHINATLLRDTTKYRTVNISKLKSAGYFEVRVMGGADYHERVAEIKNTIGRFMRALEIAMDPDAYRNEYLKKLVKFHTSNPDQPMREDLMKTTYQALRRIIDTNFSLPRGRVYFNHKLSAMSILRALAETFSDVQIDAKTRTELRSIVGSFIKQYGSGQIDQTERTELLDMVANPSNKKFLDALIR